MADDYDHQDHLEYQADCISGYISHLSIADQQRVFDMAGDPEVRLAGLGWLVRATAIFERERTRYYPKSRGDIVQHMYSIGSPLPPARYR